MFATRFAPDNRPSSAQMLEGSPFNCQVSHIIIGPERANARIELNAA